MCSLTFATPVKRTMFDKVTRLEAVEAKVMSLQKGHHLIMRHGLEGRTGVKGMFA